MRASHLALSGQKDRYMTQAVMMRAVRAEPNAKTATGNKGSKA